MKSGIYKIINLITNKLYVGSAVNLENRWRQHKQSLGENKHRNSYLQNSWNKQNGKEFEFIVIEYCDKNMLIQREQYWLDYYNFKTKKALKETVAQNKPVQCYQPGLGPDLSNFTGKVSLEGPHYPAPHSWYAQAELRDGVIIKVS